MQVKEGRIPGLPHMRSQGMVLAGASREKHGSWTMRSPFVVVDHTARRDGGPAMPRHLQQQPDSSSNCSNKNMTLA